jgi:hypothetical protein
MRVAVLGAPESYWDLLPGRPEDIAICGPSDAALDLVHAFFTSREALGSELPRLKQRIARNGIIWISWPKKASRVATDVTENVVRAEALPIGLVDVKVCAVDEVWSGLKLVIRKSER